MSGTALENWRARGGAVDCFLAQRKGVSADRTVHSSGMDLMVEGQEVAFWHHGVVFILPHGDLSDSGERALVGVRLGQHLHNLTVVEMGSDR